MVHAQIDHRALARGQLGQVLLQSRDFLVVLEPFVARIRGGGFDQELAPGALAPVSLAREVEGDRDEPRAQAHRVAQMRQVFEGPQPGFLQHLARILAVGEEGTQACQERGRVSLEESMEGRGVPDLDACDQIGLGDDLGVDRRLVDRGLVVGLGLVQG